jgi:hypothetical protein
MYRVGKRTWPEASCVPARALSLKIVGWQRTLVMKISNQQGGFQILTMA